MFLIGWLTIAAAATAASDATKLSIRDFKEKVEQVGHSPILALFEDSDSSSAARQTLVEAVSSAAKVLQGLVTVYTVEQSSVAQRNALKFYIDGNAEVVPERHHTAAELIEWVMPKVHKCVNDRMKKYNISPKKGPKKDSTTIPGKVVKLTAATFDSLLMADAEQAWLVKFYAPWCGHCKALEPTWKDLAKEVGDKIKIAEVDATVETALAQKFQIQGYPTLLLFPAGKKSPSKAQPYQGPRELGPLTKFALKAAGSSLKPVQLLSQTQFDEICEEKLCVVAILPHILDSSAAERKKYIKTLKQAMTAEAEFPIKYLWLEGGNNLGWERSLHLEFGWPAVVAVSKAKNFYSVHRGGYTTEAVQKWIRGLGTGRVSGETLPEKLPQLGTVQKWDGKDAPKEEEGQHEEL